MKDFRVAMMQLTFPQADGVDERIRQIDRWTRAAAEEGADLVWFGELCVTSYLLDSSGLTEPGEVAAAGERDRGNGDGGSPWGRSRRRLGGRRRGSRRRGGGSRAVAQ